MWDCHPFLIDAEYLKGTRWKCGGPDEYIERGDYRPRPTCECPHSVCVETFTNTPTVQAARGV